MLEALRCRFCTGFINRRTFTCEYCGTVYMRPREPYTVSPRELIVVREAPLITYGASVAVDDMFVRDIPQHVDGYVRSNLVGQFAEKIVENINIEEEPDPFRSQRIYRARLRIVKPDYKWGA